MHLVNGAATDDDGVMRAGASWVGLFVVFIVAACANKTSSDEGGEEETIDASAPPATPAPSPNAGRSTCTEEIDCPGGIDCEHIEAVGDGPDGICTDKCTGNTQCTPGTVCAKQCAAGLEGSCLIDCATAACPSPFTCVTVTNDLGGAATKVCVPASWSDGAASLKMPAAPPEDCD